MLAATRPTRDSASRSLALAAFEGPEVEAAIERALTDTDWQVRQAAEDLSLDPLIKPVTRLNQLRSPEQVRGQPGKRQSPVPNRASMRP